MMKKCEREQLLEGLCVRFEANRHRHPGLDWAEVRARLESRPEKLHALSAMEATGGEPDVLGREDHADGYLFCDCSTESPVGRRSVCFDPEGMAARKEHKPKDSAIAMAAAMGISLLTEAQYRRLQTLEPVDLKTSSWIATPPAIRKLGGALFGDRRYDTVFVYHNGAQSYFAGRGFRGCLVV